MSKKPASSSVYLSILLLLSTFNGPAMGQATSPDLLTNRWKAKWIAAPEGSRREAGVFHFRKSFTLAAAPAQFIIHVSADQRYQLYINGWRVAEGPARVDFNTAGGYYVAGPGETHHAARHPWGWETLDFDDAGWPAAVVVSDAAPRGLQDSPSRWFLVPRTVPMMEEKLERLAKVARA